MQFVGLFVLIILACLFLNSFQGCSRDWPNGAMCYARGPVSLTAEYTCPVCGQKTLYDKYETARVVQSIEACRREFDLLVQVSPLKMKLDESSFCAKCSPNATEHLLGLIVFYEDGTFNRIAPIYTDDLTLLRDYFEGRLTKLNSGKTPEMIRCEKDRVDVLLGREVLIPKQKQ